MATLALAAAGSALATSGAVGAGAVAGGFLATAAGAAGGFIGSQLGGIVDNALFGSTQQLPDVVGAKLADTGVQVSTYGSMIPITYGRMRLAGNVIWAEDIRVERVETTTEQSVGGKGGGANVSQNSISYNYYATLAIGICEGVVDGVLRVWADSKPIGDDVLNVSDDKYNVYYGDETQTADPIMESFLGNGNVPAYRGLAYVVIKDFPLAEYGNRIPNFTFEIERNVTTPPTTQDLVRDVVLIPGSGEFVYDTQVITKLTGENLPDGGFVPDGAEKRTINMNNFDNKADVLLSLDNLQATFPNLQRVSLVVAGFSTSKFLASGDVIPKVETAAAGTNYTPNDWSYGDLGREGAQTVKVRADGSLNYGGTPSDASVINLLTELSSRGIGVMFYPFLQIDTTGEEGGGEESKPWRGRMTPTSQAEVDNWFTKVNGYNEWILHYANLSVEGIALKDNVDKFVIGSEMRGITQYSPVTGSYPGVDNFIALATSVKTAVGSGVEVGYAADWSEYHSVNGWFNMDPLWMHSSIDFIGIDYYMPLTPDIPQTQITKDLITQYLEDGEGWGYFYLDAEARTGKTDFVPNDGTSPYAWKNIEAFWKASAHTNPDSSNVWSAQPKKIILTEIGFPSVDGAANQPNVFYDPNSVESFYPRGSRGRVDFAAQRDAINATFKYWQSKNAEPGNSDFMPELYLWTWDARPYPQFPDLLDVWADGGNWQTGHWVNGKLGGSNLGAVVENLLSKVGFTDSDWDTSRLDDHVDGYINTRVMNVRNYLTQLASVYFFDSIESEGVIKFIKRGGDTVRTLTEDNLVININGDKSNHFEIIRKQELELPNEVSFTYLEREKNYQNNTQISQRQTVRAVDKYTFNVPIVLTNQSAKQVADITLYNRWTARNQYRFALPSDYIDLEPGDVIDVSVDSIDHNIRLTSTTIDAVGNLTCKGVSENVASYDFYRPPAEGNAIQQAGFVLVDTTAIYMDLPLLPTETDETTGSIKCALSPLGEQNWQGAVVYRSDDGGEGGGNTWNVVTSTAVSARLGTTLTSLHPGVTDTWDLENTLDVFMQTGQLSSTTEIALLNGSNVALVGNEIIQFQNVEVLDGNSSKLRLSKLLRGRLGTEWDTLNDKEFGSSFVIIDSALRQGKLSIGSFGIEKYYKAVTVGATLQTTQEQAFTYNGVSKQPYAPVHIKATKQTNGDWRIEWVRRTRSGGQLRDGIGEVPLNEEAELYEVDIIAGEEIIRTMQTNENKITYTQAQQTADFGGDISSVEGKVYQISAVVGRGVPGTIAATIGEYVDTGYFDEGYVL